MGFKYNVNINRGSANCQSDSVITLLCKILSTV